MISSSKYKQVVYGSQNSDLVFIKRDCPEKGWLTIKCNNKCAGCNFEECFVNDNFQEPLNNKDERDKN